MLVVLDPYSRHELGARNPNEHLSVDEEGQTAKHLALREPGPLAKSATNTLSEIEVVRHAA